MKSAALVATLLLLVIAVVHVLRLFFQVPVIVGSVDVPMWASAVGALGAGALALWLWREQRR